MYYPEESEVAELVAEFNLPDFPETDENLPESPAYSGDFGSQFARFIYLSRFGEDPVCLVEMVTLADAREYCQRDDTAGPGWFCAFNLV